MRPDCRGDQIVALPAGDEGLNLVEYLRPHIEDHAGDERPQAHFFGGKGRYIRVVVHVVVAGGSETNQLQVAQLHAPANILLGQAGLKGPDLFLQPGLQLHVVCVAPKQCHGQVSVTVHEARDGQLAVATDLFLVRFIRQVATDSCDFISLNENVAPLQELIGLQGRNIFDEHNYQEHKRGIRIIGMSDNGLDLAYSRLKRIGDPLAEIGSQIQWEAFAHKM